mmetsp:Transcript_13319/g.21127  ORF Transcript_13319/g.21127 Transcript_13319/m.21127 type:complete len:232 (+) Transcript_13319:620-1315(+)
MLDQLLGVATDSTRQVGSALVVFFHEAEDLQYLFELCGRDPCGHGPRGGSQACVQPTAHLRKARRALRQCHRPTVGVGAEAVRGANQPSNGRGQGLDATLHVILAHAQRLDGEEKPRVAPDVGAYGRSCRRQRVSVGENAALGVFAHDSVDARLLRGCRKAEGGDGGCDGTGMFAVELALQVYDGGSSREQDGFGQEGRHKAALCNVAGANGARQASIADEAMLGTEIVAA